MTKYGPNKNNALKKHFGSSAPAKDALHICVQLELFGLVAHCKVALGDAVAAGLKGHLVACQPALEAHHRRTVDRCAVDVVVHITADIDVLPLVSGLDLATLLAEEEEEVRDGESCTWVLKNFNISMSVL